MNYPELEKWDARFITLAEHIASWSRDPSTKVGAVIVDEDKRVVSLGYNGFPKGVQDTPDRYANREVKYRMVCHAERNAILFARRDLTGCILYTTFFPCAACAGMIIQAGIDEVVTIARSADERWAADIETAHVMLAEANVAIRVLDVPQ